MEISPFLGSLLGNIFLGIGIAITIYITKIFKNKFISLLDYFTSITVGLLIGIIFLGFLPEIVNESNIEIKSISIFILIGLFLFYVLELFLHWHHCRDLYHNDCSHSHIDEHNSGSLMFVGTLIHNIFHGIELFILFSIDVNYGIFTTFAIFLHAVPQNIANYIMNHKNIKYSYIASFGGIIGAILTYPFYDFLVKYNFEILSIIAGGLLYIALTDIFPNIKQKGDMKHKIIYLFFMIFGIFIFYFFNNLVH